MIFCSCWMPAGAASLPCRSKAGRFSGYRLLYAHDLRHARIHSRSGSPSILTQRPSWKHKFPSGSTTKTRIACLQQRQSGTRFLLSFRHGTKNPEAVTLQGSSPVLRPFFPQKPVSPSPTPSSAFHTCGSARRSVSEGLPSGCRVSGASASCSQDGQAH